MTRRLLPIAQVERAGQQQMVLIRALGAGWWWGGPGPASGATAAVSTQGFQNKDFGSHTSLHTEIPSPKVGSSAASFKRSSLALCCSVWVLREPTG